MKLWKGWSKWFSLFTDWHFQCVNGSSLVFHPENSVFIGWQCITGILNLTTVLPHLHYGNHLIRNRGGTRKLFQQNFFIGAQHKSNLKLNMPTCVAILGVHPLVLSQPYSLYYLYLIPSLYHCWQSGIKLTLPVLVIEYQLYVILDCRGKWLHLQWTRHYRVNLTLT